MTTIGKKTWVIAEGYLPEDDESKDRAMISHETACILNTSDSPANIEMIIYFSDRDPAGPYKTQVPSHRTKHIRFNDLNEPERIPRGVDYSSVIRSDVPIVVQHTRLDSRSEKLSLLSTLAYGT